ncbi:hypothetical protein LLH00_10480 [bacterium]|nr:hypothetical protein [bacterium]
MGSLLTFAVIAVVLGLTLFGWTLVLKLQRDRKISDLKIQYLRTAASEESAYQHYIQAERQLQDLELKEEKCRQTISILKSNIIGRRNELHELIDKLRIIKRKYSLVGSGRMNLDDDLELTKLTSEVRSRLVLNNEDKKRVIFERMRIKEAVASLTETRQETGEHETAWETVRREMDKIEIDFRKLDEDEFVRFCKAFIKKRSEEGSLDPEREIINLLLMLNNKQGMLYVRRKEAAKEPTTSSLDLIHKYNEDIRKLEMQLRVKAKRLGITAQRVEELKRLFVSGKSATTAGA